MVKSLYYGIFNLHCGLKRKYVRAYTKEQAKVLMARLIAKEQEVMPQVVLGYLKEHPDSFEIKLEGGRDGKI